jgi:hypothetical protein
MVTNRPGIIVAADSVTILGNGHSLSGDGILETDASQRETGIVTSSDPVSGLNIQGVNFQFLDQAISLLVSGFAVKNIAFMKNSVDTAAGVRPMCGININNHGNLADVFFDSNTLGSPICINTSSGTLRNLQIRGNEFQLPTNLPAVQILNNSPGPVPAVSNIYLTNNTVSGGKGVHLENLSPRNADTVFVENNHFINGMASPPQRNEFPPGSVTVIGGGNQIRITNNTITGGVNMNGIVVASCRNPGGCTNSFRYTDLRIENNTIDSFSGTGQVPVGHGLLFQNYRGDASGDGFEKLGQVGGGGLNIRNNSLENNQGLGVFFTPLRGGPSTIDARLNWWGDPAGPDGPNGDGVSAGVLVEPFLTSPPNKR